MFQRRRGHRHSTDDLTTAWYAVTHAPERVERVLDLGTGIGSVGLSVAWKFRDATITAIEVQDVSYALLLENVRANDLGDRVQCIRGDLRNFETDTPFDLVTGSPPYFDVKDGIVSVDSQRAAARFELHGDVRDYCAAAARAMAPHARFVFCFPTLQIDRAKRACAEHRLGILTMCDVVPKTDISPLFTLFCCAHEEASSAQAIVVEPPLVVRSEKGDHTEAMLAVRRTFGFAM
ncbi:MAG: tRNA1(Val) (adenine(37)-N6)-methyltransferase [Polyangiaceae bacterium]